MDQLPNEYQKKLQGDSYGNTSLMEQLKLGVRVEGLQLPPGITLTRVDPTTAEAIKAKRESIKKICQPMQPPAPEAKMQLPPMMMTNPG